MEKSEKLDNSDSVSMSTVNVGNPMDYQEPPPAYRQTVQSTTVQVTKIVAMAAVVIAAMLSISIVFSAWISTTACQQGQSQQASQTVPVVETFLQPEHLKSFLGASNSLNAAETDLQQADSKIDNVNKEDSSNGNSTGTTSTESKLNKDASSEEESNEEDEDDNATGAVTMLRLPLELNIQDHIFEKSHRSHMNCVIEKKKAEELVDEQSKRLPVILGINTSNDPRYLHFTGEKMAISCDDGSDRRHQPQVPPPLPPVSYAHNNIFPIPRRSPFPLGEILRSAMAAVGAAATSPVHIIGPIPLNHEQRAGPEFQRPISPRGPIHLFNQNLYIDDSQPETEQYFPRQQQEDQMREANNLESLGLPPHFFPILVPQENEDSSNNLHQVNQGPIFLHPQSSENRERALPHPIPIMPRAHLQHVIRPRRSVPDVVETVAQEPEKNHNRVKRCSCDCACKNNIL